jgi:hypothetical protein
MSAFTNKDWTIATDMLLQMFSTFDELPKATQHTLNEFVFKSAEQSAFLMLAEAQQYYRQFMVVALLLENNKIITELEMRQQFSLGVPPASHAHIQFRIPTKNQSMNDLPKVNKVMGYLADLFNDDDYEAVTICPAHFASRAIVTLCSNSVTVTALL